MFVKLLLSRYKTFDSIILFIELTHQLELIINCLYIMAEFITVFFLIYKFLD